MGRNISNTKWRALFLLVLGCILVASPAFNDCDGDSDTEEGTEEKVTRFEAAVGVGAVLVMVTISGYSSIYFEGMLKKSGEKITIWERNFQLALYSTLLLLGIMAYESNDGDISDFKFFEGWSMVTVIIALIQVCVTQFLYISLIFIHSFIHSFT